jgi:hypothetical protein
MATLFVQWLPRASQLRIVALGKTTCAELGWAARCLGEPHGLRAPELLEMRNFGDLKLVGAGRWRLAFVTPGVVAKAARGAQWRRRRDCE